MNDSPHIHTHTIKKLNVHETDIGLSERVRYYHEHEEENPPVTQHVPLDLMGLVVQRMSSDPLCRFLHFLIILSRLLRSTGKLVPSIVEFVEKYPHQTVVFFDRAHDTF